MNVKVKKSIRFTLSLVIAAAFLYWAFANVNLKEFWDDFLQTRWFYVFMSMFVAFIALIVRAERWRMLLVPLDSGITRGAIWDGSNIGNFLNLVLPGVGEFARCGFVTTKKATYDKTFGTMIMERAWDIAAIFSLLIIAIFADKQKLMPFIDENVFRPFNERFELSFWWIAAAAAVIVTAIGIAVYKFRHKFTLFEKCISIVRGVLTGLATFKKMKNGWLFLVYSVIIWVLYIFMTYFTFLSVPGLEHLSTADAVFISAVGNLASIIPTPGNMGPYHWLVGLAISNIYLDTAGMASTGLLCATLAHGSHAVLLIILGVISYFVIALRKRRDATGGQL